MVVVFHLLHRCGGGGGRRSGPAEMPSRSPTRACPGTGTSPPLARICARTLRARCRAWGALGWVGGCVSALGYRYGGGISSSV